MKKFLLTCAVAAAAAVPAMATEAEFGYCGNDIAALGNGQANLWYAEAIKIPTEILNMYGSGSKITKLSIGAGQNSNTSATVFISHSLSSAPEYSQPVNLTSYEFNEVTLTTPFELDGTPIYVGFYTKSATTKDYPLSFDGAETANENATYYNIAQSEDGIWDKWSNLPSSGDQCFGNASIRVIIDSPNNVIAASVEDKYVPGVVKPDTEFTGMLLLKNLGTADITSVKVNSKIGNGEVVSAEYTCDAIKPCQSGVVNITGLKAPALGKGQEVVFDILEINGELNAYAIAAVVTEIDVLDEWYDQIVVIEEGTGTGCGYCPRGYVGMEYMKNTYTDGTYYGITIHTYNSDDPMYCKDYATPARTIFASWGGYPVATVNRLQCFDPSKESCELVYASMSRFYNEQKVKISNVLYRDENYSTLRVETELTSLVDMPGHKLGLAVVTTEDEVGPYAQSNYYSGGVLGPMDGFENKSKVVNLIFNDVARSIVSWKGDTNLVPQGIEANKPVECGAIDIETTGIKKIENAFVTILLIDTNSGMIITADRVKLPAATPENVGVSNIGAEMNGEAAFYTLDGLRVNSDSLTPGLYIKRANGESTKILVK